MTIKELKDLLNNLPSIYDNYMITTEDGYQQFDEYFIICYYNLKEKWMCGGIKDEDWNKICELNVIRNENGW